MAGDWIKMRSNLWDDPKVARLCDITEAGEAPIIGGLYWLWSMADQHTEDGFLPGLTLRQIDRKTAIPGFGSALCAVGWLDDKEEGITLVRFTDHNGSSAKKRCQTAKRVAKHEATNAPLTQVHPIPNAPSVSSALAREEKRREETEEKKSIARGSRLPADFLPNIEFAHSVGIGDTDTEVAKFSDYWRAQPGQRGVKTDWDATWRNWCRNAKKSAGSVRSFEGAI